MRSTKIRTKHCDGNYRIWHGPWVADVLRGRVMRCQASLCKALAAQCVGGPLFCWHSAVARRRVPSLVTILGLGGGAHLRMFHGAFSGALVAFALGRPGLAQQRGGAVGDCGRRV